MAKNYYAILGVSPTATLDEIRSAYRRRAKQYHPDYFGKDSAPFRGIQEAYDILGNPSNRSSYDRSIQEAGIQIRSAWRSEPIVIRSRRATVEPLVPEQRPLDLGNIFSERTFQRYSPSFEEIHEDLGRFFGRPRESKSERFQTLTMEVRLTQDQADRGGRVQIRIPFQHPCPTCHASGEVGFFQCWNCGGEGSALDEFSLAVDYPPGIRDLYRVAVPLDRYGISDICPILLFRVGGDGDFEDDF